MKTTSIGLFILLLCACAPASHSLQNERAALSESNKKTENMTEKTERITVQGKIEWQNFEGGFFGLVAKNGRKYTLSTLDKSHKKDGLVVEVSGSIQLDRMTTTQFGQYIIVDTITVMDDSKVKPDANSM